MPHACNQPLPCCLQDYRARLEQSMSISKHCRKHHGFTTNLVPGRFSMFLNNPKATGVKETPEQPQTAWVLDEVHTSQNNPTVKLNGTVPHEAHKPTISRCAHSPPARLPEMQQTDSEARTPAKRSSGLLLTDSEHTNRQHRSQYVCMYVCMYVCTFVFLHVK